MTIPRRGDPEEGYHELAEDARHDLPPYPQSRRGRCCAFSPSIVIVTVILVMLVGSITTAGFVFWPTPLDVQAKEWKLNGISIVTKETKSILPSYQLNVSLNVLVEIKNPNYAGVVYDNVTVRIVYRGDDLGQVKAEGSRIEARSTANHTATVNLKGNEILNDAKQLMEDYSDGKLPLTTYTAFDGSIQFWFVKPLLKVTVACDLVLNPEDETILSQECRT
jgi:hypothetical protein